MPTHFTFKTSQLPLRHLLTGLFLTASACGALAQTASDKIAGVCMWSIYVGFQAARPHCGQSASDLDAAIDAAIPVIERRLIEIGEISAEAAQEYRAAEASMWQKGAGFAEDQEAACQSANPTLWGLTPDQVGETAAAVLAASPEMLSDDCI